VYQAQIESSIHIYIHSFVHCATLPVVRYQRLWYMCWFICKYKEVVGLE